MSEVMERKRGRPAKPKPEAEWKVGMFTATFKDGWYTLRLGNALMMHTQSEAQFTDYCGLIERSAG